MLSSAWRFRQFLRGHWRSLAVGAVLGVGVTLSDLAQPWPLKVIIDGAIGHRQQRGWLAQMIAGPSADPQIVLLRSLIALALLVLLSAGLGFAADYLMSSAGERVTMQIRQALYSHLQRLSLSYHDHQRVGDLVSRVTLDIDRLQEMLIAVFDTFIPNAFMLGGLAIVMVLVDPVFGLLSLSIAPLLAWVTYRYTLRIKRAVAGARLADAGVASLASETLAAVRWVQAFTREEHEERRFSELTQESLGAGLIAIRLKAAFAPIVDVVSVIGTILVTYVGVRRVMDHQMTLGLLLVFLAYLRALYRPMRALSKLAYVVSRGTTSAARVAEVLEADHRIAERPDARRISHLAGEVELRDVTFRYSRDGHPVLRHANLQVSPGERIGIMGRSGGGKSTLVSLIPRFYDPQEGAVLLDGTDVREFTLASLRNQVSLVLQEPILFYGSLLDNIRYGDPSASMGRVREVVEDANVEEFLDQVPGGILGHIGERGVTLSGGQRQRIVIARAMLRDAPIVILDEPTTGLDQATEQLALEALDRLTEGRTTFIISHHPQVLAGVNRLLSIEHGQPREASVPAGTIRFPLPTREAQ
jgi:ATP-binding cassette, subfamily B, bacterial